MKLLENLYKIKRNFKKPPKKNEISRDKNRITHSSITVKKDYSKNIILKHKSNISNVSIEQINTEIENCKLQIIKMKGNNKPVHKIEERIRDLQVQRNE